MKILYLVNFDLKETKGLGLITKNKVSSLRKLVEKVDVISSPFSNSYIKILYGFLLDFKGSWYVLIKRPDCVISRGSIGFFTIILAKLLGVKTVREVHAYGAEEVHLLPYNGLIRFFLKVMAKYAHYLDLIVDLRIFNHPDLLEFYQAKGFTKDPDIYVYNGYSEDNKSKLTREQSRDKFGLSQDVKYLVFVGSATKWHGVEYIIDLQKEFLKNGDLIKIVCGGASISEFDTEGVCLSISPLDASGCSDLIKAADLCLLPVKNNRVSPGSPLKLYDYIVNKGFVVAQENMHGYCDEVIRHGVGFCVDFSNSKAVRESILDYFTCVSQPIEYPDVKASWENRMQEWLDGMNNI